MDLMSHLQECRVDAGVWDCFVAVFGLPLPNHAIGESLLRLQPFPGADASSFLGVVTIAWHVVFCCRNYAAHFPCHRCRTAQYTGRQRPVQKGVFWIPYAYPPVLAVYVAQKRRWQIFCVEMWGRLLLSPPRYTPGWFLVNAPGIASFFVLAMVL